MFWSFCTGLNQVIIAGLGIRCFTDRNTPSAHIQGHLSSAENLLTMVKSFHGNSQPKEYVNPSLFSKEPCHRPMLSLREKQRSQIKAFISLVTTWEPEVLAV